MAFHLPRDAVSVPVGRQVLDSCLETLGVTPDTRADIALALSEACANVIQHAGPGEEYEVQVSARNCRCTIEVVNTGSEDKQGEGERQRRAGWPPPPRPPPPPAPGAGRGQKDQGGGGRQPSANG